MVSTKKLPTSWNLSPLYGNDSDPLMEKRRAEMKEKSYRFINTWKNRNDYLNKPAVLKEALDEYDKWMKLYAYGADEMYYFDLRTSQDENNPELKAKYAKIEEFTLKIQNDIQFFTLNISRIAVPVQKIMLTYKPLTPYKHYLKKLFDESNYILSDKEEKILNLKSITSYGNWVKLTSGFLAKTTKKMIDEQGKSEEMPFTRLLGLLESRHKPARDSAGHAIHEILRSYADVAEAEINSVLMNKKIDDELRGFKRPDSSRHLADDIESDIVDVVIDSVSKRFAVAQRFYTLKSRVLGIKKLKYHERNIPIGDIEKKYTYRDTVDFITRVFSKLDSQFTAIFQGFVKNGQIDVYPAKGKRSGAFCAHYLLSEPTYILLNHTDKLTDVLTLAHEMGHGINNELVRASQNALNFGTPTSTAEVASTFMEDFVLEELLHTADDETKFAIMMKKLNDDISSIFRQIAAYTFEQELHTEFRQQGYLSKEVIGALFQKHMASYMGPSVEQSPGSENWWVYWNHIRYFFYVYSYASGLLISKALQHKVRSDKHFISDVKTFLSAGKSKSPREIFSDLGIDISKKSFWDEGIQEIERLLLDTEHLAKSLKKI